MSKVTPIDLKRRRAAARIAEARRKQDKRDLRFLLGTFVAAAVVCWLLWWLV